MKRGRIGQSVAMIWKFWQTSRLVRQHIHYSFQLTRINWRLEFNQWFQAVRFWPDKTQKKVCTSKIDFSYPFNCLLSLKVRFSSTEASRNAARFLPLSCSSTVAPSTIMLSMRGVCAITFTLLNDGVNYYLKCRHPITLA